MSPGTLSAPNCHISRLKRARSITGWFESRVAIPRYAGVGNCSANLTIRNSCFSLPVVWGWPPLWSSGQNFWLQIQRSRVRSPALPDFLSSSGSGTGSTQPREVNWGATWMKKSSGSRSRKQRLTAVGTRCADHVTPLYPQNLALTFSDRQRPLCRYSSRAD